MATHPTIEQLAKLPKWTQDYINDINRERDTAVKALNDYCDNQTPSPVYIDELVCTGEQRGPSSKTRYIQTYRIRFDWQGVALTVTLLDNRIYLSWHGMEDSMRECALIPQSHQAVELISKTHMR